MEHDGSFLDLSVRLGKMTKEETILHPYGFYFEVAGKTREVEAIKFYLAIRDLGYPVVISDIPSALIV